MVLPEDLIIQPVTDFNPFTDRKLRDFAEPIPSLAARLFMEGKVRIQALPSHIVVVDLSHWNDEIDYAALRASGVQAVIIKCSEAAEGTYYQYKDIRFEENWRKALDEGFPVMVYHFYRDNKGSAEKSWFMKCADAFLNDPRINGKTAVWLDVEWKGGPIDIYTRARRSFGFCDLIKGEGMRQGMYCSPGLVAALFPPNDPRWANVFQWVAHWTFAPMFAIPSGWLLEMIKAWQRGISNTHSWIPKITGAGAVDYNHCYFDSEDALRSWMGQEIAPPPPPPNGHDHPEMQEQINLALYKTAELQVQVEDLEARDDALTADVVDINRRLQSASDELASGGGV